MNRLFMIVESLPVDNVVCQHQNATRLKPFKTSKQMVPPVLSTQRVAGIYNDRGRDGEWANGLTLMPDRRQFIRRDPPLYAAIKRPKGLQLRPAAGRYLAGAFLPAGGSRKGGSRTAPAIIRDDRDSTQMIRRNQPFIPIFSLTATRRSGREAFQRPDCPFTGHSPPLGKGILLENPSMLDYPGVPDVGSAFSCHDCGRQVRLRPFPSPSCGDAVIFGYPEWTSSAEDFHPLIAPARRRTHSREAGNPVYARIRP